VEQQQLDVASDAVREFDALPALGRLETDRFCDGCGYNLIMQAVRRDALTQLALCRCPECGRFHAVQDGTTAGRVWLRRLGTLAATAWVVGVLMTGLALALCQFGITIATFEELTTYRQVPTTAAIYNPGSGRGMAVNTPWQRAVREEFEGYGLMMAFVYLGVGATGFVLALLMAVAMHHWHRLGYLAVTLVVAAGAAALATYAWVQDYPFLQVWATRYAAALAAVHVLGGVAGAFGGRPLARLAATLVLPPKPRQALAFLWLADKKPPPHVPTEGTS